MYDSILFLTLVIVGYVAGSLAEKRHYHSIEEREKRFLHLPLVTTKNLHCPENRVENVRLVYGSAVISIDYFKHLLAGLRSILGGRVKAYESLLDRARREAILRMKQQASGTTFIMNARIETSAIGRSQKGKNISCVEAMAYGTAVTLKGE